MAYTHEPQAAKTILMVEDEPDIGTVLTEVILQETAYQMVLVNDAMQALLVVKDITPDLLILNYHLPHMNGIELYDRLHAITGLEQVPTMMMSAHLPRHELSKRHILGMSKPLDLDEILATVDTLLMYQ
jgi:DNA-binding response OmpR family regulator